MSRATPKPCPRQADAVAGPETHSRSAPAVRRGVVALENQAGGCACAAPARSPQAKRPGVPRACPRPGERARNEDRESAVSGKRGSERLDLGGGRSITKKK